jgi:DNA-3-methyladenine glycosylase II
VRKGMQRLYGLPELPSPDEMRALADRQGWAPYRSVASWYMWQVIDQL